MNVRVYECASVTSAVECVCAKISWIERVRKREWEWKRIQDIYRKKIYIYIHTTECYECVRAKELPLPRTRFSRREIRRFFKFIIDTKLFWNEGSRVRILSNIIFHASSRSAYV